MLGDNADSIYLEITNPWHRDNHVYQHFIDPNWNHIHIGYKEALQENRISPDFVIEQQSMLTPREFKVLYDAEFPEESEDQLIPFAWIQRAIKAIPEGLKGAKKLGVDVARGGQDSTVLTYGYKLDDGSYVVTGIKEYNQQDTMQTVSNIMQLNQEQTFDSMVVDTSGLGAGVTDRLREAQREGRIRAQIIPYEGGRSSAADFKRQTKEKKEIKTRFMNIKAEAYFKLRALFEEDRIIIPKHAKLIDQLCKMKWDITTSEKIRIYDPGTKEGDTAEEKSPDFADSLCYFQWEGTKSALVFSTLSPTTSKP
jgi:hypothetical protein